MLGLVEATSLGNFHPVYWRLDSLWCVLDAYARFGVKLIDTLHTVFFAFNVISGFVLQIVTGNSAFPGLDCAKGLLMVVPYPFINVIATALMGYRAWYVFTRVGLPFSPISEDLSARYHHKDSRNLSSMECNGRSLDIRRIVLFMTESGLLYCLYWVSLSRPI